MLNCPRFQLFSADFPDKAALNSGDPPMSASCSVVLLTDVNVALVAYSFTIEEAKLYLIGFLR